MRLPNKLDRYRDARDAYFHGGKTQKEIALEAGITDRTLRNWIKEGSWERLRQNANLVPALMLDSYCSQLIQIQNTIAARPDDERTPQPSEIEMQRKLLNCIINMKKYPSEMFNHLAYGITTVSDEVPYNAEEKNHAEPAAPTPYKPFQNLLPEISSKAEILITENTQTIESEIITESTTPQQTGNKEEKSGNKAELGDSKFTDTDKQIIPQSLTNRKINTLHLGPSQQDNNLPAATQLSPDMKRRQDEIKRVLINEFQLFPLGDNYVWDKQKQVERHLTDKEWEQLSKNGFTYEQIKSVLYMHPAA